MKEIMETAVAEAIEALRNVLASSTRKGDSEGVVNAARAILDFYHSMNGEPEVEQFNPNQYLNFEDSQKIKKLLIQRTED